MVRPFIVFGFEMHGDHIFVFSRPERVASQALGKLVAPRDCGPVGFRKYPCSVPSRGDVGGRAWKCIYMFWYWYEKWLLGVGGRRPPFAQGVRSRGLSVWFLIPWCLAGHQGTQLGRRRLPVLARMGGGAEIPIWNHCPTAQPQGPGPAPAQLRKQGRQ